METQNKNLWIGLGVVAVVALGFAFWTMNKATAPAPVPETQDLANNPTEDKTSWSVNTGSGAATISYANALVKYKDARLQLDTTCQASPDKMTFKNGSYMMVDNRSPKDRVVKLGSTFNIKGYGFKIVQLSSAKLPATWYVDCDKSQNVATVTIQK